MSTPLKVGLLGCGGISRVHMTPYLTHPDQVRLTAICDMVEPLARDYARAAGVDAVYTDLDDMLYNADIEAIDICTNHAAHAPITIAAARAGKHVLVEKAMANTLQACRDMIEETDKAGVTLMIAHHLRHSREATAVKRFIDDGNLGEIQAVRTHVTMGGGGGGRPGGKTWSSDFNMGGGVLMLNSIHHIDLLRYYIGNVTRVMAVRTTAQPHMLNGAEDLCAATLEFENGAIGGLFASWTTNETPERAAYLIFGSEGTVPLHFTGEPPELRKPDSPFRHHQVRPQGPGRGPRFPERRRSAKAETSAFRPPPHEGSRSTDGQLLRQRDPVLRRLLQDGQGTHQQRPRQHRVDEGAVRHLRVLQNR